MAAGAGMRKLTPQEAALLDVLRREGSILLSPDDLQPVPQKLMADLFDGLVKKKRAVAEATDGGVRYHAAP
jgi:hypothetical protein